MAYPERREQSEIWVAIYCRLSEEDRIKKNADDDSLSIQNQKSMLVSYAELNNWRVYNIYSDDDYTGADRNRPAFNEMIADARAGKFQIVLCKSQSRFTREMEMVEHYLHDLFPVWGIRFIGLVDNADTAVAGNKKARQINGLMNEWYLEDLSENIKRTLTDRREKGYHIGSFCAYGYQKDPERKGHLIPDPEAAEVVRRIFEMYVGGMGRNSIARKLNAEGIPNPTEYKIQHGIRWNRTSNSPRSHLWQYYSIASILENEVYIGNLVQGKYESISYKTHRNKPRPREKWIRVEGTHEAIIERALWDRAQEIRLARTKAGWNGEVGMFAGKCRCMYCGYVLHSGKAPSCGRFLRCHTHALNPDACQGAFVSLQYLEKTVLKELQEMIARYLDLDAAESYIEAETYVEQKRAQLKRNLSQAKMRLEKTEKAMKVLYTDRVESVITLEEYQSLAADYRKDAEQCRSRIELLQKDIEELEQEKDEQLSKRELLLEFADIKELNYDIVNTLIDFIEVGKRAGHYRHHEVPVIIHWKF